MTKASVLGISAVPDECPEHLRAEIDRARANALRRLNELAEADRARAAAQREAEAAVLRYENLLLEVRGQGTLDLE